jgi:hypothetical protein
MGEVYRATDTALHRAVALKVLPEAFANDAERVARFKREAQVLASLNHPHIAQIYGFETVWLSRSVRNQTETSGFWMSREAFPRVSPSTRPTMTAQCGLRTGKTSSSASTRSGQGDLYIKPADGGEEHLMLKTDELKTPSDWSRDYLLFTSDSPKSAGDLWALPLKGDANPSC